MTITVHGYNETGDPVDIELYYDVEESSHALRILRPTDDMVGVDPPVFFSDTDLRNAADALPPA